MLTSFLVTGFSNSTKCVNFVRFRNGSRSANSAILFAVRTSVVKPGIEFARLGWICRTRFLARRSMRSRGKNGKLPSEEMSLSVKSIASWSWGRLCQNLIFLNWTLRMREEVEKDKYLRNTQIFNSGNLVPYTTPTTEVHINPDLKV
jgi:hypothetical protein